MPASRLAAALEERAFVLPEDGRIALFRPQADEELGNLPQGRLHIIHGFKPDADTFAAQGFEVSVEAEGQYAAALVFLTRSKDMNRALVAEASARSNGPVIINGLKTDGVESLLREVRKRAKVGEVVSKAHGKLFSFSGGDFADWALNGRNAIEGGFCTAPGMFSADAPDPASVALASALPSKLPKRIADFGAGWGYLSRSILSRAGVEELHLIEAEHAALDCARVNAADSRAKFHWADATTWRPEEPLDAVIMNPPFHARRAAEPEIGRRFIASAAAVLKPSGTLWLVANRHLPYESEARARFAAVSGIHSDPRYKILAAAKPRRRRIEDRNLSQSIRSTFP